MIRTVLALLVLTFAWGFALGFLAARPFVPYCPTEDSCRADYAGGVWTIEEVTP
jgi:hypothetical protein